LFLCSTSRQKAKTMRLRPNQRGRIILTMSTLILRIDNMHCGTCIRRVTQTLNALPGTHAQEVRVGSARIETAAAPEQIQQALSAAGYPTFVQSAGA
jgi:copper chaperone CopZ